ncbi:MAG: arsenosugar biosynthesis radical SAM (seleno)protein ArsS [Planctomycetia bacterium]
MAPQPSPPPPAPQRLAPPDQLAALAAVPVPAFQDHLARAGLPPLSAGPLRVLQVNVGKLCNQACRHCHVDAGPHQVEANMGWPTFEACLEVVRAAQPPVVDITGGAPELNPHFRRFVEACRGLGVREVIDRCNLTVLLLPAQRDLAAFLARMRVHVVASLPAVHAGQTDAQRGEGVFERSLEGLRRLNALGYGHAGTGLELTLMSNPAGAFLPPPQAAQEARFRQLLRERHGIEFTRLVELTNMPIHRFLEFLLERGDLDRYLGTLSAAFNPGAVEGVMCRDTLSVGWDGRLYDCDFNQMLGLEVASPARTITAWRDELLRGRPVRVARHCLGCTAGQGSSCGGATAASAPPGADAPAGPARR